MPIEFGSFSLGTVVGGGVVGVTNHYLAKSRTAEERRIANFNKVASDFIKVVSDELKDIYPDPVNWPRNIDAFFKQKLPNLQAAVNTFSHVLPDDTRSAFLHAWTVYLKGEDGREIDHHDYGQYVSYEGTAMINDEPVTIKNDGKKNFKHNVDVLLKFAKPK
jgi:hypothetical protein